MSIYSFPHRYLYAVDLMSTFQVLEKGRSSDESNQELGQWKIAVVQCFIHNDSENAKGVQLVLLTMNKLYF